MTDDSSPPDDAKARRQARLDEALRANLKKRKAQARRRADEPPARDDQGASGRKPAGGADGADGADGTEPS